MSKSFVFGIVILLVLIGAGYWLSTIENVEDATLEVESTTTENMTVILKTTLGDITIELFTEKMPITTGNFLKLAQEGFYDGIKFHRVIPNFMVQVGDPLTKDDTQKDRWGTGGPGYTIEDEFVAGLSNIRGTLSMANSGPNSGGSQFFINVADNISLDFDKEPLSSKHPVFGRVVEGMDVVDTIVSVPTEDQNRPLESVAIESISITE